MKIILIGLGSIGKRHLRNIIRLGYNDICIVSRAGVLPEEFNSLKVYSTINQAIADKEFDAAIICSPTAQHITQLKKILEVGIKNIYLEKPVSHKYDEIEEVNLLMQKNNSRVMVGFDMHYDLGLLHVKKLLDNNTIGNIISINAQVGQYLPDWRPHEDYSSGMSAKKETGGGVMLDLVHEFDYLQWLIGKPTLIASLNTNSGSLNIETEDVAEVLVQFENGVIGTIHLDYLQPKLVRNCMVTGSKGSIFWNLVDSKVIWILQDKTEHEFNYTGFERNDRFINIMKDFLLKKDNYQTTSFLKGLKSLQMVLAAKYSCKESVFVSLASFNPALK